MTPADDIRLEMEKVASLVSSARRLVACGKLLDLSALEGKVEGVCTAIAGLEAEDGRQLKPAMTTLLGELDRLAVELQQQYQGLGKSRTGGPRAAEAYSRSQPKTE